MASLAPPSPTSEQELSTINLSASAVSSQALPPVIGPIETTNLDILSAAAAEAETGSVVAPEPLSEPPAATDSDVNKEPTLNGLPDLVEAVVAGEPVEPGSSSTTKSKPNLKRKRELSPVAGVPVLPVDNNSQNGPRTRRRTEYGGSIVNGPGGFGGVGKVYDLSDGGRPIISCDYCPLHWHMDCLDPPMTAIPGRERKWMCPNHIEHIFVSLGSTVTPFVCLA
jgi:hypothetical protein